MGRARGGKAPQEPEQDGEARDRSEPADVPKVRETNGNDNGKGKGNGNGNVEGPVDRVSANEADAETPAPAPVVAAAAPRGPPKKRESKARNPTPEREEEDDDDGDDDDDDDQEYEVEEILDSKKIKGKVHFLIRWKGYQSESDTWEPESTLSCPELIAKFRHKQSNGKTKRGIKRKGKPKKENAKKPKFAKRTRNNQDSDQDDEDDEKEYEVDKILEVHHKKNGLREFLIHWKGWGSKHNSWEPEENLNCVELIKNFMKKVSAKRDATQRELRADPKSTKRFTLTSKDSGRRLSKRSNNRQRVRYDNTD